MGLHLPDAAPPGAAAAFEMCNSNVHRIRESQTQSGNLRRQNGAARRSRQQLPFVFRAEGPI